MNRGNMIPFDIEPQKSDKSEYHIGKHSSGRTLRFAASPGLSSPLVLDVEPPLGDDESSVKDELVELVAGTGRWQVLVSLLLAFTWLPNVSNHHAVVFFAPYNLEFWCTPPKGFENWTVHRWINLSQPSKVEGDLEGSCYIYDRNYTKFMNLSVDDPLPPLEDVPIKRCYSFQFDQTPGYTITEKWSLVCEDSYLIGTSEWVFHAGLMIGNIGVSFLSDKFGRRRTLLTCLGLQPLIGIACATAPSANSFIFTRFLLGITLGGATAAGLVVVMEIVGNKKRTLACGMYLVPRGLGLLILAAIWSIFHHWQKVQFAITFPSAIILVFMGFVPESPQWLLCMEKGEHAEHILRMAAGFNGNPIPSTFRIRKLADTAQEDDPRYKSTMASMLHHGLMCKRISILSAFWASTFYCYAVVMVSLCVLLPDIEETVLMAGAFQVIAFVAALCLICNFGHKRVAMSASFLSVVLVGICFGMPAKGPYLPQDPLPVLLVVIMICLCSVQAVLFNYSGRVFPTVARCSSLGITIMIGNLGELVAPIILGVEIIPSIVSLSVLLILCLAQVFMACTLIYINNKELPDTIMDAVNFPMTTKPLRWAGQFHNVASLEEHEIRIIDLDQIERDPSV